MATVIPPSPTRESVTTIAQDGSRVFLHPADVRGRFLTWRRIAAAVLILVYVVLPWIPVNGYPAVFLDVAHLRFHFFGLTLAAQDMWMLFFLISGLGFTLFFATALAGRLWCGWACPHSVFLEHVYRPIERLIDGDATQRRRDDAEGMTQPKLLRRVLKQAVYLVISALIAHLFLSYFVSLPGLYQLVTHAPFDNWPAFAFVAAMTGILHFNFTWFREQTCIVICPYGRIQSALIDDDTVTIGYDARRGEPRGKASDPAAGHCIDCRRCVQVCPTGIDIRQGLQLECIGCAQCIDACDEVMDKLQRPRGLVRYDSQKGLEAKPRRFWRPRVFVYLALLGLGFTVFTYNVSRISPAAMSFGPLPGVPRSVLTETHVRNNFSLRVVNKEHAPATYTARLTPKAPQAGLEVTGGGRIDLDALQELAVPVIVSVERAAYAGGFEFLVEVLNPEGRVVASRTATFTGPSVELLRRREAEAPAGSPVPAPTP